MGLIFGVVCVAAQPWFHEENMASTARRILVNQDQDKWTLWKLSLRRPEESNESTDSHHNWRWCHRAQYGLSSDGKTSIDTAEFSPNRFDLNTTAEYMGSTIMQGEYVGIGGPRKHGSAVQMIALIQAAKERQE